jgi:hypothetical protein
MGHKAIGQHHHREMPMQSIPTLSLIVVQAILVLGVLVELFNGPTAVRQFDQPLQQRSSWQIADIPLNATMFAWHGAFKVHEASETAKERMAVKVRTPDGRALYARRKVNVEPVCGQLKEARGFRRFLLRGLDNIRAEWCLVCLTHNLRKLWRYTWAPVAV